MKSSMFVLCLAVFASAEASAAASAATTFVEVSVSSCGAPGFDATQFREALRTELRDMGVSDELSTGAPIASIAVEEVGCGGTGHTAVVQLIDRVTHKVTSRGFELRDVDISARPRLVALGSVELLRASLLELEQRHRHEVVAQIVRLGRDVRVTVQMKSAKAEPTKKPNDNLWFLGVRGSFQQWGSYRAAVAGGGVEMSYQSARARAFVNLLANAGVASDELGEVSLSFFSARAGADLLSLGSALQFGVGPRLQAAAARFGADPAKNVSATPSTEWTLMGGLGATVSAPFSQASMARGGVDIGYTFVGIRALAAERATTGIAGAYLGANLGIDWAL